MSACANLRQEHNPLWHDSCTPHTLATAAPGGAPVRGRPRAPWSHFSNAEAVRKYSSSTAAAAAAAGKLGSGGARLSPGLGFKGRPVSAAEEQHCLLAARRGVQAVKMAWGSAQEATALHALTQLMPNSSLHEDRKSVV